VDHSCTESRRNPETGALEYYSNVDGSPVIL
jgi:hypothetical protein